MRGCSFRGWFRKSTVIVLFFIPLFFALDAHALRCRPEILVRKKHNPKVMALNARDPVFKLPLVGALGADSLDPVECDESWQKLAEEHCKNHRKNGYVCGLNFEVNAAGTPDDARYSELWGMAITSAPAAWDYSTGSSDVVVAVIDTGVDYTHPDLSANIWVNPGEIAANGIDDEGNGYIDDVHGWDFYNGEKDPYDDNGHGTHCAGTIGAVGNNGAGVVGVNWNVKIIALKFLSGSGSGFTSDAVEALDYATDLRGRGINLIATNNSWGGTGDSQTLRDAVARAVTAGVLTVAAAGNSAEDNDYIGHYPSNYDGVLSVAASTSVDQLASFSNYGAVTVALAAPGQSILSTIPGGGYASYSGTSMAAPHVTGAAALFAAYSPGSSAAQIGDAIRNNVDRSDGFVGWVASSGRLNLEKMMVNGSAGQSNESFYAVSSIRGRIANSKGWKRGRIGAHRSSNPVKVLAVNSNLGSNAADFSVSVTVDGADCGVVGTYSAPAGAEQVTLLGSIGRASRGHTVVLSTPYGTATARILGNRRDTESRARSQRVSATSDSPTEICYQLSNTLQVQ